jgi:hypothetical protein
MTNVPISGLPTATSGASTDILPIVQGGTTKQITNANLFASATGISLSTGVTGTLPIANGGTAAVTAAAARTSLGVAASGANTDITSVALTTGTISTTPTTGPSITNKSYVDAAVNGLTSQIACNYASTGNFTVTYNNGTSGVGATLTATANGALSIDGVTPAVAQRVLIKDQTTTLQNGPYSVTQIGSAGTPFILTRVTDYDQSSEMAAGDAFYVISGSTLANTTWVQQTPAPITVGTTAITFLQFGASGNTGLPKQPYTINTALYANSATTLTLGVLPIAAGGTNAITAAAARTSLGTAASGVNTDITSIALTTGTISTTPTLNPQIVNKLYVDSAINGLTAQIPVGYATTVALSVTYNNGTAGVGATLTSTVPGSFFIDGGIGNLGDRILVKDQTTTFQNGVYTVTTAGAAGVPFVLTRATDYDTSNEIQSGDAF